MTVCWIHWYMIAEIDGEIYISYNGKLIKMEQELWIEA